VISCDEDIPEQIGRKLSSEKALRYVETVLDARERRIIILRYGLSGASPLTQKQVAERLKISRSYVSRLEKTALEKLSAAMKE
jgi:RNA polymerase sporulation-specific sigma factor